VTASSLLTTVSVDGEISGRAGEDEWNIEATARHTRVRLPDKARSGAKLHPTGDLSDVVYLDVDDLIRRTALLAITGSPEFGAHDGSAVRLSLETPGGVRVSGNEIDLLVASKLRVLLRGGMTFIGGSVETQRGFIQLFDRRYDVIRANVSFDESEPNNAKLDIKLSHEFQTTTLYVTVGGTLDKPTLELFADPGSYDKPQLLGILMGGDPDDPDVGQAQTYGEQATTAVSNALLGQLQGIVKLPVDKLSVTVGEGSDAQTTRFEVGKWITDSLFLGYIYRLNAPDDKNLNEAQIRIPHRPALAARGLLRRPRGRRGGGDLVEAVLNRQHTPRQLPSSMYQ
jgi:translocation and assembly module TamB